MRIATNGRLQCHTDWTSCCCLDEATTVVLRHVRCQCQGSHTENDSPWAKSDVYDCLVWQCAHGADPVKDKYKQTPMDRATPSRPIDHIALYTKLDAECDQQVTVIIDC